MSQNQQGFIYYDDDFGYCFRNNGKLMKDFNLGMIGGYKSVLVVLLNLERRKSDNRRVVWKCVNLSFLRNGC